MRRFAPLVLLLTVACSGGGGGKSTASSPSPSADAAGPPSCARVLVNGSPVTKAQIDAGCTEPVDGSLVVIPTFACAGGTQLASPDYSGGHFWGLTGGTWHKVKDSASDPGYGAAYAKCHA
jgi:hypothetical protein